MMVVIKLEAGYTGLASLFSLIPVEQRKIDVFSRCIFTYVYAKNCPLHFYPFHNYPNFLDSMTVHAEIRFLSYGLRECREFQQ